MFHSILSVDVLFLNINNIQPQASVVLIFELAWTKSRKSYCTTPGVGVGVGISKKFNLSKKFNNKVFYVMGKALSGELSCPCDRSCFLFSFYAPVTIVNGH